MFITNYTLITQIGLTFDISSIGVDYSDCINPVPPNESCFKISGGVPTYFCDGGFGDPSIVVDDLIQFYFQVVDESCFPSGDPIEIDEECVFQKAMNAIDAIVLEQWVGDNFEGAIRLDHYMLSCHHYCKENILGTRDYVIRLEQCGESTACCLTSTLWEKGSDGNFSVGSVTHESIGECTESTAPICHITTPIPKDCQRPSCYSNF